jgi:hypothetical protein
MKSFFGKTLSCSCFFVLFILICENAFAAGQSSTNFLITQDVFSGGGGVATSTNYTVQATLAQPSPIGDADSVTYINHAGFWHNLISTGDLNGDGQVDLQDVIYGLQVLTADDAGRLYIEADVNGDRKIGMDEVIYVLEKVGGLR